MAAVGAFVDADVLSAPMTRTLLLVAAAQRGSRFHVHWSPAAEAEADRALRPGQTRVAELRQRFDWGTAVLVPDATPEAMAALTDTSSTDRHILASAVAAGLPVVVTRNVHDFGRNDLAHAGVSAVHPDRFLSQMVSEAEYRRSLEAMAVGRAWPPNTPETLHAAFGAGHPLLFEAMRTVYPGVDPKPSTDAPPAEVFRGNHCFACGKRLSDPESLALGVGPGCRRRR